MTKSPNFTQDCLESCKLPSDDDMIDCLGYCSNRYHSSCIGISRLDAHLQEWVCESCQNLSNQEMSPMKSQDSNRDLRNSQRAHKIASVENIMETNEFMQRVVSPNEVLNLEDFSIDICASRSRPIFGPVTEAQFLEKTRVEKRIDSLENRMITPSATVAINESASTSTILNGPGPAEKPLLDDGTIIDVENGSNTSTIESEPIDETDYVVKAIVDHGSYDDGTIGYKVRWHGYKASEDTWHAEKDLSQSYDILKAYKEKHKLGRPTCKKPFGSTQTNRWNPDIWNTADRVMQVVHGYLRKEFRHLLEIKVFEKGDTISLKDALYLIDYGNHLLVGFYDASKRLMTIADGENCYLESLKDRAKIHKLIKVPIKAVRFTKQSKIDHCSSSAAIICIKFANHYGFKTPINDPIAVSRSQHDKIIRAMHKGPSRSMKKWKPVQRNAGAAYCEYSGCGYKGTRKQVTAHSKSHIK